MVKEDALKIYTSRTRWFYTAQLSLYGRHYTLTLTRVDCRYIPVYLYKSMHSSVCKLALDIPPDRGKARVINMREYFRFYVSFCRLYLGVAPESANRPAEDSKSENAEFSIDTTVLIVGRISIFQHRLTQYLATQRDSYIPRWSMIRNCKIVVVSIEIRKIAPLILSYHSLSLFFSLLNKINIYKI